MTQFDLAIETTRLSRSYGRGNAQRWALRDVSLEVREGEIHGLLGPNGAGKTTLCKILSTVIQPTEGTARVAGKDVVREGDDVRRTIAVAFGGDRGLYGRLTVRQNLEYWAAVGDVPRRDVRARTDALLERVGITTRANSRVETLSRGLKQRVHLARALVTGPRVLVLDEPTNGLDPAAAIAFRALIREIRDTGCSILMSTHDLVEAQQLCDRATLLDAGRVLTSDTIDGLRRLVPEGATIMVENLSDDTRRAIATLATVSGDSAAREVVIRTASREATRATLLTLLDRGHEEVQVTPPTMQDVYLSVIGDRGMDA